MTFVNKKINNPEWRSVRLKDVVSDFVVPMRDKPKLFSGTTPWCRIEDFSGIYLSESKSGKCVDIDTIRELNLKVFQPGTVLVSCSADLGRCAVVSQPLVTNQTFIGLYPSKDLLGLYLYYQMLHLAPLLNRLSSGTTISYLSREQFENLSISIPPLPEQQKIAEILSTVDEKIAVIDEQLAQTQELKKGLMQRLLTKGIGHTAFKDSPLGEIPKGWEDLTFNDLVKFSGGAQPPRSTFVFEPQEGYIRLVQIRDYRTDKFKTYIPEALARKTCTKDDIMIGRYGPPIFQILRGIEGAYNVALIKAIPNEVKILREYLFYYISQHRVWAFIENLSQRGGGQTGVDLDELKKYSFPLPPLPEQRQIADILTTVDDKLGVLAEKKTHYQTLKKGLMQQLLTGQRRVRVGGPVEAVA